MFICISVFVSVHVYTHVYACCISQKRVSELLELELQIFVTTWVLRTEPGSSAGAIGIPKCWELSLDLLQEQ